MVATGQEDLISQWGQQSMARCCCFIGGTASKTSEYKERFIFHIGPISFKSRKLPLRELSFNTRKDWGGAMEGLGGGSGQKNGPPRSRPSRPPNTRPFLGGISGCEPWGFGGWSGKKWPLWLAIPFQEAGPQATHHEAFLGVSGRSLGAGRCCWAALATFLALCALPVAIKLKGGTRREGRVTQQLRVAGGEKGSGAADHVKVLSSLECSQIPALLYFEVLRKSGHLGRRPGNCMRWPAAVLGHLFGC